MRPTVKLTVDPDAYERWVRVPRPTRKQIAETMGDDFVTYSWRAAGKFRLDGEWLFDLTPDEQRLFALFCLEAST